LHTSKISITLDRLKAAFLPFQRSNKAEHMVRKRLQLSGRFGDRNSYRITLVNTTFKLLLDSVSKIILTHEYNRTFTEHVRFVLGHNLSKTFCVNPINSIEKPLMKSTNIYVGALTTHGKKQNLTSNVKVTSKLKVKVYFTQSSN
jgi:hypothetical protein